MVTRSQKKFRKPLFLLASNYKGLAVCKALFQDKEVYLDLLVLIFLLVSRYHPFCRWVRRSVSHVPNDIWGVRGQGQIVGPDSHASEPMLLATMLDASLIRFGRFVHF